MTAAIERRSLFEGFVEELFTLYLWCLVVLGAGMIVTVACRVYIVLVTLEFFFFFCAPPRYSFSFVGVCYLPVSLFVWASVGCVLRYYAETSYVLTIFVSLNAPFWANRIPPLPRKYTYFCERNKDCFLLKLIKIALVRRGRNISSIWWIHVYNRQKRLCAWKQFFFHITKQNFNRE